MTETKKKSFWHRLNGPLKIGVIFGLIGVILAVIGMFRGFAPMTFRSFAMAILISGLSWGIVSWAIAAAAVEVEKDVQESEEADQSG